MARHPNGNANSGDAAENYIVILQPTIKPEDLLNTVLKGKQAGFVYGTVFVGFSVDR